MSTMQDYIDVICTRPIGRLAESELPDDESPTAVSWLVDGKHLSMRARDLLTEIIHDTEIEMPPEAVGNVALEAAYLRSTIGYIRRSATLALAAVRGVHNATLEALGTLE